jgi:hypothetical protein
VSGRICIIYNQTNTHELCPKRRIRERRPSGRRRSSGERAGGISKRLLFTLHAGKTTCKNSTETVKRTGDLVSETRCFACSCRVEELGCMGMEGLGEEKYEVRTYGHLKNNFQRARCIQLLRATAAANFDVPSTPASRRSASSPLLLAAPARTHRLRGSPCATRARST